MRPRPLSLIVLAVCLLTAAGEASAQSVHTLSQQNAANLTSLFNRTPIAPRIVQLHGPDSLRVGEAGLFVAAANVESATLPLRMEWSFGDGATAHSLSARHQYRRPGTYPVVFRVSNAGGAASDTLAVIVVPGDDAGPPSAHRPAVLGGMRLAVQESPSPR